MWNHSRKAGAHKPARATRTHMHHSCSTNAGAIYAHHSSHITTSAQASRNQLRNAHPAHPKPPTHSGGTSHHSISAWKRTAAASPSARLHPQTCAAPSPRQFTNRTTSFPMNPHVATANGRSRNAVMSDKSFQNRVRLVSSPLAAVHPACVA